MILTKAYVDWSHQQQNYQFYLKTRSAFSKAWVMLDMRMQCFEYNKRILGEALGKTKEVESVKKQAAEVMVQVLTFAHFADQKNPEPYFTADDLMEYTKGPLADPERLEDIDPVVELPKRKMEEEDVLVKVKPEALEKRKQELAMKETKTRGKQPKPVVQIDTKTLKPIKTYNSRIEAERETGAHNIDRAIERKGIAGGFYWCNVGEESGFKPNEASLRQMEAEHKKKEKKAAPEQKMKPVGMMMDGTVVMQPQDITKFSNEEIINEMKRRGWKGTITMTINVEL